MRQRWSMTPYVIRPTVPAGARRIAAFCVCVSACLLIAGLFPITAFSQTVGEKAKLNNVTLLDGSKFDVDSVKGKVTLLYFWASWCPICRKELPVIQKHYVTYKDRGFEVVAINFRDKLGNARKLLDDIAPIDFPVAAITDDYRSDYPKLWGTPTWYLVDRGGVIRKVIVGEQVITGGWFDGLKKDLEAALKEDRP